MPRRPRVFVEGGIYHVYNRFARGEKIFRGGDEAERFLELVKTAKERDGLEIFAWVLMANHFHLALRTGPIRLSRTMGFVKSRFGAFYNRRHGSKGPLWQSRYQAKMVDDSSYTDLLIAYIHLNPVAAGIVDDPADYPLSGHREIIGRSKASLVDVDSVLATFGDTVSSARSAYVQQLKGEHESEWRSELPGRLPWWKREPDRPVEPEKPTAWIDEMGISTGLDRPSIDARSFVEAAANVAGVQMIRLAGKDLDRSTTNLRCLIAALGVERWDLRPRQLGDILGRRGDVVSRWVRWGVQRRRTEDDFCAQYERMDKALYEVLQSNEKMDVE